ncbi:MAG: hypothetical protein CVU56_24470 [Deltaproteobacteria bacterium HGW-Deltaproteobacteria-14]|nr:MAG: hypothetical protein CVU56_24470 [Deltaproteobacteria bacterium HGW-Deltaproteobacteria-14]
MKMSGPFGITMVLPGLSRFHCSPLSIDSTRRRTCWSRASTTAISASSGGIGRGLMTSSIIS